MKLFFSLVAMIITGSFSACNSGGSNNTEPQQTTQKDTLKLKGIDSVESVALSDKISSAIDTSDTKGLLKGKGKLWKVWEKLHKNCQRNEMTKGMTYLGVSNTLGVGSILLYDESKKSYIASFPMNRAQFPKEQHSLLFKDGTSSDCQYQEATKVAVDFLINSRMEASAEGSLNAAIGSARAINSKIDSWKQNVLYVDAFQMTLNRMTTDYAKDYISTTKLPNRYVIVTEIQINGFSALITTKTTIDAGLKAKLEQGITQKVGDTDATLTFSYVNDKTIKASTAGTFVVFGTLYDGFQ
jgi:hypothetical protein